MNLYIANATMQDRVANFRVPEVTKTVQLTIPRGRQVRVPKDLTKQDIDSIQAQLARYGAIELADVGTKKPANGTIPYVMSTDKPVPAATLLRVINHNKGALKLRGDDTRKMAAIASAQVMEATAPQTLGNFETTLMEEQSGGMQHEGNEQPVAEALRVSGADVAAPGAPVIKGNNKGKK